MKRLLAAVLFPLVAGCATLAPTEVRKVEFIIETKLPKAKAYQGVRTWLAKNQGNSKVASRVENEAEAHFVTTGNYTCNVLRQAGDTNDYAVDFTLDFQAKDGRARFQFEELVMKKPDGTAMEFAYGQLVDAAKVDAVKPCLKKLADTMVNAGVERQKADNW